MKKLESTIIKNSRGQDVQIKAGDSVKHINEDDLKIFGINPDLELPQEVVLKLTENLNIEYNPTSLKFLYEFERKKNEHQYGNQPYKVLGIFERESHDSKCTHEWFELEGQGIRFPSPKRFFYKVD